jgi:hypothetical protein
MIGGSARGSYLGFFERNQEQFPWKATFFEVFDRDNIEATGHGIHLRSVKEMNDEPGDLVLAHHECPDGSGYPRGSKGEEIPLEARIVRVPMYSPRSWESARTNAPWRSSTR